MAGSRTPTLYDLLQVRSDATTQEVRNAWRRLAQDHHPDRGGSADAEAMVRINRAYEVLSDPDQRARYDQQLLALRKPLRRDWLRPLRQRAVWVAAAALGTTAAVAAAAWMVLRPAPAVPARPVSALPTTPAEAPLALTPSRRIEHWGARPMPTGATAPGHGAGQRTAP